MNSDLPRFHQYTYGCRMRSMRVHADRGRFGGMRSRLQTLPLTSSLDDSTCVDKPPGRFHRPTALDRLEEKGLEASLPFWKRSKKYISLTNVVLVHGAWADASCWSAVISGTNLRVDGGSVTSVKSRDIPEKECIMS